MQDKNLKPDHIILVVEDEMPLQNAIRKKLERNNFSVVTARNTDQAFKHLEDVEDIEVIWLDHYLLGKGNGLNFLAKIKEENSKWKDLSVFVVSNTASPDKVQSYLQLGVEKYYTKADYKLDTIIKDIKKKLENNN
jgi:DNA-binding NtrC family response regulator